jgi:hypothetical protein
LSKASLALPSRILVAFAQLLILDEKLGDKALETQVLDLKLGDARGGHALFHAPMRRREGIAARDVSHGPAVMLRRLAGCRHNLDSLFLEHEVLTFAKENGGMMRA